MTSFDAVFENGRLRPLGPTDLKEGDKVRVAIEERNGADESVLDTELIEAVRSEADPAITLEAVRNALASIPGTLTKDFEAERDERHG
ncbi:MAG: antitoxin family protein [Pirellulales bacterium]